MTRDCRNTGFSDERPLSQEASAVLQQIGAALDEHRPINVYDRGFVVLGPESSLKPAKVNHHEQQRRTRPSARARKGATTAQGTGRPSNPDATPRRIGDLRAAYQGQLDNLAKAYPDLRAVSNDDGMWILATSVVIGDLKREAMFVIGLPFRPGLRPRGWAFWATSKAKRWIGPRHTNFDGSICAFSPDDGAWSEGGDLKVLLGLFSLWTLKHLHLEVFSRWPGKQYTLYGSDPLLQAYYRLTQCGVDELCACGSETLRYKECCRPFDQRRSFVQLASHFVKVTGGFANRKPPQAIIDFAEGRTDLPDFAEIFGRRAEAL